ncbi:hypothetical protein [Halorussus amylolyticus]|uniref:hypothetical protein n=1 Tax=Halorussus amylolyticus TaxID=1126242 RepID=UPI00138F2A99|nr:hypothetical protein [Halorussus amylolyticus]
MLERWLDYVFFAGLEISILSIPALSVLFFATPRGPISLAALTAVAVSTCAAATFRGGWVEAGEWPRAGDPYTLPLRVAYYSATIGAAGYAGAAAHLRTGTPGVGMVVAAVVSVAAMAALPRAVAGMRALSNRLNTA